MKKSYRLATMTEADCDLLEANIRPREGAPFQLPVEHYFALCGVKDGVERSWYQHKAESEGLSLRELRRAIRADLFGKIIGKPAPKDPKKKLKPLPKHEVEAIENHVFTPKEEKSFQKLVKKVNGILDRAEAKGIPMRHVRHDLLDCRHCGAYEDILCGEDGRKTFLKSGKRTPGEFQVIHHEERSRYYVGLTRFKIRYDYYCGVCGAHQEQKFKKEFDDKELFG